MLVGSHRSAAAIRAQARALGFDAVGFAGAGDLPAVHHERYLAFIHQGRHGDMGYLARHAEARRRVDGPEILAGAHTVISVALSYYPSPADLQVTPPLARRMARHSRGWDYHDVMRQRLGALAAFVRGLEPGARARPLCDTAPVLERAWAVQAGLGFVGKNGMLIVPGVGSFAVLGEVVTTVKLPVTPAGEMPSCGECDACLRRCPAAALIEPYVLDARRCISYLTIEARSRPTPESMAAVTDQLFGCDRCQLACPFNDPAAVSGRAPAAFHALPRWAELDLGDLLHLDEEGWSSAAAGSALSRLSREALARNVVAVAAAELRRGAPAARRLLERARRDDHEDVQAFAEAVLARSGAASAPSGG